MNMNEVGRPQARTRMELLKEILRYRFFDIVLLSVYVLIFFFPAAIWLIFSNYLNISEPTLINVVLRNLVLIPLIMIFGIGVGGALHFVKKLIWQDGSNLNGDFINGIKSNYKQFLLIFFLVGVLYFLLKVDTFLILNYEGFNDTTKGILSGISYVIFFLLTMILFFMQTQAVTYRASTKQLFLNALRFTFGMILKNVGIFFIVLLPFFLFEFIPIAEAGWIIMLISGVFYFGFSMIIFSLYSHSIFDRSINKDYPEIVRKGLAKDESSSENNQEEC